MFDASRANRSLRGACGLETALRPLRDGAVCDGAAVAAHDGRFEPEVHGRGCDGGAQALGSADRQAVGSPKPRVHVGQCHNSRIMSHGHPLLHVHPRCLVVCLVHVVLVLSWFCMFAGCAHSVLC